jgi:hypothetical protein
MTGLRISAADEMPFAGEVAAYLASCAASPVPLDPAYHPTQAGAVKLIFHRRHRDKTADQRAEAQIRAAFRALTAPPARRAALPDDAPVPSGTGQNLKGTTTLYEPENHRHGDDQHPDPARRAGAGRRRPGSVLAAQPDPDPVPGGHRDDHRQGGRRA